MKFGRQLATASFAAALGAGTNVNAQTSTQLFHGDFGGKGTISSFFLYDGVASTASHHDIDIEFIGGTPGKATYTSVWIGY